MTNKDSNVVSINVRADYETLAILLNKLFVSPINFKEILTKWFPDIVTKLPPTSSSTTPQNSITMNALIYDSIRILDRNSLIDKTFFALLGNVFYKHRDEIDLFAASWRSGKEILRSR